MDDDLKPLCIFWFFRIMDSLKQEAAHDHTSKYLKGRVRVGLALGPDREVAMAYRESKWMKAITKEWTLHYSRRDGQWWPSLKGSRGAFVADTVYAKLTRH